MAMGRKIHVPRALLREMDDLKQEDKIDNNSDALKKLTDYARVGRELQRIQRLNFAKLPTPQAFFPYKKKKRGDSIWL